VRFRSRGRLLRPETVYAVTDVDLQIRPGEAVALVGESGSGKTTLGRATLGLVPAATGRVVFDGTDLGALDRRGLHAFRRRAQAVFQDPFASISPFMSVFESVEEPLLIHGPGDRRAREQRVLDILEQVRLVPARRFAAAYPHTLSGGQRQRVGIARALVLDPDYVVADEPVSMIDASSRAEILDLMRELQQRRRLALLYITHDIATARHFSDRIAVMYLGRIVEFGPSRDVVADPQHPYTKALLAAVPEPDPANRGRLRDVVPGEPPDPIRVPSGCAFHPRCPVAIDGVCPEVLPLLETAAGRLVACHLVTGVPLPPIRRA
jgi:oligopeptide/dipeptide ABC transporter ATP-binding protein